MEGRVSSHRVSWVLCAMLLACDDFGRYDVAAQIVAAANATESPAAVGLMETQIATVQASTTVLPTDTATLRVTVATQTISTSTATTATGTSTTTTPIAGCGGVMRCLGDGHCAQCLEAINSTSGFPHTLAGDSELQLDGATLAANNIAFFQTLHSTPLCSTSATVPGVIHPALQELTDEASCVEAHGMGLTPCVLVEYACFTDPDCRQCLAALFAVAADGGSNGTKAAAFRSLACTATSPALLNALNNNCGGESFPSCSFRKHQCSSLAECGECLTTLGRGDGAGAARQCPGSTQPSALAMDSVVTTCIDSNAAACDFFRQRCTDNADCGACLAGMSNGDSLRAAAADWSAEACQRTLHNANAVHYLGSIATACPGISACRLDVTSCVFYNGDQCIACINGSATQPSQVAVCAYLFLAYSLDTVCQSCPASVHTINSVVFATATVGGASAVACIVVAMAIVAHGHDRESMRDRIVVGLMMANAVYSTANVIPINALRTGVVDCGRLAMSFDTIRFGRAWWFCGKYGLVGFELFILGASIRAMHSGMAAVSARAEAVLHLACCALAALAFAMFYTLCARINEGGYNTSMEMKAYTNEYNYASSNDDFDDVEPSATAASTFRSGRDAYDNLVRGMLVAWDAVVGVAVGLWIVLRAVHLHALRSLRTEAAAAARAEASDVWADTRRTAWETRRMLLEARREAFNEVAKPLEPYIFVFVVFAAPAFVMSTTFCQDHSGASADKGVAANVGGGSTDITYGACDVWCEFVLAFRSLATIMVYLVPSERRAELVAVRSMWRKFCSRVVGCIRCDQAPYARLNHGHIGEYELDELGQSLVGDSPSNNGAVAAAAIAVDMSSWHIDNNNITQLRQLGAGAFGGVWEGRLLPENEPVAIKILFGGAVDEDGDVVDLNADEDFRKECLALQRVDSPYLIKFFGFGTTADGKAFIVTELLGGGSLESALRDNEQDIPWRLRVTFGVHVALGMEHLHQLHMLHRDLKSANVLLNYQRSVAKVCDFGLARVVRPARRHVVVQSPFTGARRHLPLADGLDAIIDGQSALPMDRAAVSIVDSLGQMTKAAGTLLWMAPEVFRGDQHYTKAVDVYSFGIVLWELATCKVPWDGELSSDELAVFEGLNRALQSGRRPTIPDIILQNHGSFVAVMQRCWAGDPATRPTFSEAARDLAAILNAQYE